MSTTDSHPLHASLEALRAEIAALDVSDTAARARVDALIGDIEQRLDSPEDDALHQDVIDKLEDSIMHFEVAHPTMTRVLNDIMNKLSAIGL